eukprot:CAMPEP_0178489764 /NCGR_PEP_ID=MMETSP0696-20121128/10546_1 /TAXON_ID=265572 /ORGANISM="Extubocellulus spinifer, Strain CCMP396" /LENGTH=400 /DNA_ID=CAMNT_0020117579 /DNA_START=694 /DNA_END=1897 /DNA_ORIENTATION=+
MSSRGIGSLSPGGSAILAHQRSPQSGGTAAPVNGPGTPPPRSPQSRSRLSSPSASLPSQGHTLPHRLLAPMLYTSPRTEGSSGEAVYLPPTFSSPPLSAVSVPSGTPSSSSFSLSTPRLLSPPAAMHMRSGSLGLDQGHAIPRVWAALVVLPPLFRSKKGDVPSSPMLGNMRTRPRKSSDADSIASKAAQAENDTMVYLEGPCVYTCAQCRTHLTSHDDIISKSFHGRHGRAYLFDQCVNVTIGEAEDRLLITGLHSVCDIFCKRCKSMVGWTYARAYEASQKYKEGKFIIEKINLYLEESHYDVSHPAGERGDRWRKRSMSWGSDRSMPSSPMPGGLPSNDIIYEYRPGATTSAPYEYSPHTPRSKFCRTLSAPPTSAQSAPTKITANSSRRLPSPPNL